MKNQRNIYMTFVALLMVLSFTSCKEDTKEKVDAAVESGVEETKEAAQEVENAAVKAGQEVENAAKDVGDALVEGTNYNATGQVPCSVGNSAKGNCEFGVMRRGNGDADVYITTANGKVRLIYFQNGKAVGYDKDKEDLGTLKSTKESDNYKIQIGDEHYEINEAIVYGG